MQEFSPPAAWTGRTDLAEGADGNRWHQIVTLGGNPVPGDVALIGYACDAGVRRNGGRPGAAAGPAAIRSMLANLPAWPGLALRDLGDVVCTGDAMEGAQENLAAAISRALSAGAFPVALGGGHDIAFASFSGLCDSLAGGDAAPRIGTVNLDAHLDLRADATPSSGTPFRQAAELCRDRGWPFRYACLGASLFANTAALFRRAGDLGVEIVLDDGMGQESWSQVAERLRRFAGEVDHLYLTIDLDALPAAIAPGVSAPAAFGISAPVIERVIDLLAATGKLRLADIAEMNPHHDIDGRTARIAARFVARLAARLGRPAGALRFAGEKE